MSRHRRGNGLSVLARLDQHPRTTERRHAYPFNGDETDNEYSHNMQIADLNAPNAAVAVVRWKKVIGFYSDQEGEHFSTCALAATR
jgi:hypothetical protein